MHIIDYALLSGADQAECCLQKSHVIEISIVENRIVQLNSVERDDVLVRTIVNGKSVSTLVSSFDLKEISSAIDECILSSKFKETEDGDEISAGISHTDFFESKESIDEVKLVYMLEQYVKCVNEQYPNIIISDMRVPASEVIVVYGNSNKVLLTHSYTKYDFFIEYITDWFGEKRTNFYDFAIERIPNNLLKVGEQNLWYKINSIANKFEISDNFTEDNVLLCSTVVEDILIEGIYSFCNSTSILAGTSIWMDSIGEQVADTKLSISVDSLNENIVCGERITDNGTISQPFELIENGILKNFYLSRKAARIAKLAMSKNTSDSFIVATGTKNKMEIISDIDRGILISRYSGGDISREGVFSGLAKGCFFIEKGKIVGMTKDLKVSGNITEILYNIAEVSLDYNQTGYNVIPWMLINRGIKIGS